MLGSYYEVINTTYIIDENHNQLKWCTVCTPLAKLVKGHDHSGWLVAVGVPSDVMCVG